MGDKKLTDTAVVMAGIDCQYESCSRLATENVEFQVNGVPHCADMCSECAIEFEGMKLREFRGKRLTKHYRKPATTPN